MEKIIAIFESHNIAVHNPSFLESHFIEKTFLLPTVIGFSQKPSFSFFLNLAENFRTLNGTQHFRETSNFPENGRKWAQKWRFHPVLIIENMHSRPLTVKRTAY